MRGSGIDAGAVSRSAAAAGGAVAGTLVAVPVSGVLASWLFDRIGRRIFNGIISGSSVDDLSGIEGVLGMIFLVVVAAVVTTAVVVALIAPVFVLLPAAATSAALFAVRAGLILRTLWLTLAGVLLLGAGVRIVTAVLDVSANAVVTIGVVGVAAFAARIVVELWEPARARRATTTGAPAAR